MAFRIDLLYKKESGTEMENCHPGEMRYYAALETNAN